MYILWYACLVIDFCALPLGCRSTCPVSRRCRIAHAVKFVLDVSRIAALFCVAAYWLFLFTGEFPTEARMTMVHRNVNASAERPSLFSLFLLPKRPHGFWINIILRKAEIRMRSKRSKKNRVMRKATPQPARLRYIKRKEALNCLGRQRQKLIYHAAHRRGC